jgi:hypothetical protein
VAESVLVKQQLLILNRSRKRSPHPTARAVSRPRSRDRVPGSRRFAPSLRTTCSLTYRRRPRGVRQAQQTGASERTTNRPTRRRQAIRDQQATSSCDSRDRPKTDSAPVLAKDRPEVREAQTSAIASARRFRGSSLGQVFAQDEAVVMWPSLIGVLFADPAFTIYRLVAGADLNLRTLGEFGREISPNFSWKRNWHARGTERGQVFW